MSLRFPILEVFWAFPLFEDRGFFIKLQPACCRKLPPTNRLDAWQQMPWLSQHSTHQALGIRWHLMERIRVGGTAINLAEINVDVPRPLNEGRADTPLLCRLPWLCPGGSGGKCQPAQNEGSPGSNYVGINSHYQGGLTTVGDRSLFSSNCLFSHWSLAG